MQSNERRIRLEELQAHIEKRNFDFVLSECLRMAEEDTASTADKATAHQLIGTCLYLKGDLMNSVEHFKKALSLDPKNTDSAISLSIIYNDVGKYEEAKKIYEIANRSLQLKKEGVDRLLDSKFALKHIELGDLYYKYHRYDDALTDYSRAARLSPTLLTTRIKLAKVYAKKGFTTRAIQELQQLCHEYPAFVEARVHLGLMYYSQGNVIDAEVEWEKAKQQAPDNEEVDTYLHMVRHATETSV